MYTKDSQHSLVQKSAGYIQSFLPGLYNWYFPHSHTLYKDDTMTVIADRATLRNALKNLPIASRSGLGPRTIAMHDKNGILFSGLMCQGMIEVVYFLIICFVLQSRTSVEAKTSMSDPLMVNIRMGQAFSVKNPIGYALLPFCVAYCWIDNRFALNSAIKLNSV